MVSMILIKGSPMLILDNTRFRKVCETLSNAIECSNERILASLIIFWTYPSRLLIVFVLYYRSEMVGFCHPLGDELRNHVHRAESMNRSFARACE